MVGPLACQSRCGARCGFVAWCLLVQSRRLSRGPAPHCWQWHGSMKKPPLDSGSLLLLDRVSDPRTIFRPVPSLECFLSRRTKEKRRDEPEGTGAKVKARNGDETLSVDPSKPQPKPLLFPGGKARASRPENRGTSAPVQGPSTPRSCSQRPTPPCPSARNLRLYARLRLASMASSAARSSMTSRLRLPGAQNTFD